MSMEAILHVIETIQVGSETLLDNTLETMLSFSLLMEMEMDIFNVVKYPVIMFIVIIIVLLYLFIWIVIEFTFVLKGVYATVDFGAGRSNYV